MGKMDVHIGEILARNARMYPDDLALVERTPAVGKRSQITWKEFSDRADKFSNVLRSKGIEKGDKVVHFMNNSIDWLIAYFGIVRTGAWVVPLNFRFMAEDLKYCSDVAQPKAMVFDRGVRAEDQTVRSKTSLTAREYICLGKEIPSWAEDFTKLVNAAPATRLATEIEFDDPCGLYFTSGTTGQPKPILLTHKNMASACITENAHHHQTKKDNFILIPPLYHTGAKMHWFGSFIVGAPRSHTERRLSRVGAGGGERGRRYDRLAPRARGRRTYCCARQREAEARNYKLDQWRLMHIGAQPVPPKPYHALAQVLPRDGL